MATTHTASYDINRDGLADLALPDSLEIQLRAVLAGDNAAIITTAVNDAITTLIREHGVNDETGEWYGDWSSRDVITAILAASYEVENLARVIDDADGAHVVEIRHGLCEGHEYDYGDEQGVALSVTFDGHPASTYDRNYILPAGGGDDDGARFWVAFRGADALIEAWLTINGVDPTATDTYGTGWAVKFDRSDWRSAPAGAVSIDTLAAELGVTADEIRDWALDGLLAVHDAATEHVPSPCGQYVIPTTTAYDPEGADLIRAHFSPNRAE